MFYCSLYLVDSLVQYEIYPLIDLVNARFESVLSGSLYHIVHAGRAIRYVMAVRAYKVEMSTRQKLVFRLSAPSSISGRM